MAYAAEETRETQEPFKVLPNSLTSNALDRQGKLVSLGHDCPSRFQYFFFGSRGCREEEGGADATRQTQQIERWFENSGNRSEMAGESRGKDVATQPQKTKHCGAESFLLCDGHDASIR